ncbi:heavy-metal-associated domain-containing protein [Desulfosediminicola sp.]|uniref:heavy-metal-associated domain-containing protein n=1 Tax=Desulfosediminicola sp. TaxID=2886825 RepID=UPI003AF27F39
MSTVKIKGMSCNHCVNSVREALAKIPDIKDITIDLEAGEAKYAGEVDPESVKQAIAAIGFEVVD